jgi:hypothetical protein
MSTMMRKLVVPMFLVLMVVMAGSWTRAAAARPLQGDDLCADEEPSSGSSIGIALPSTTSSPWRGHMLPPLEMKQTGAAASCTTHDGNIWCPP